MTRMDHPYAEEHGLVEAYLEDRLGESEREAFEAHYFACETCLEQLEAASDFREGMRQAAAEDTARAQAHVRLSLLAGLALLSRRSRLALAGLLLLLLALPLALLLVNRGLQSQVAAARSGHDRRIASLEAQLRTLQSSDAGERRRLEEELAKERRSRPVAEAAPQPQVNLPLFTLAAVRSGEDGGRAPVNRLQLAPETPSVIFTIELATIDFPSYRASLRDGGGKELWQGGGLHPDSRDSLVFLLPARLLSPGLYRLTLEGVKAEGQGYAVGMYPLQVTKAGT
jgi:hypothetical protein